MANQKSIFGDNCLLQIDIDSEWYDVFCSKSMSFDWVQEEIETTSINSSKSREYVPGMSSGTATASGVTKIDNSEGEISWPYLFQTSIRSTILSMRVYMVAEDGDTLQISFDGFIINLGLTGDVSQFSQSAVTFRITGTPVVEEIVNPPLPGELQELYLELAEGATSVSDPLLDDVEIFLVHREHIQYNEVSGTPGGEEFQYNDASNSINFLLPGNPASPNLESVHIIFKPN